MFVGLAVCSCSFPRPADVADDAGVLEDGNNTPVASCVADGALRCDRSSLVRCNSDGTAELQESCSLGCNISELRCNDVDPSNGLAPYLDMTGDAPELNLGSTATIDTDDGSVLVDQVPLAVTNALVMQPSAPAIRVFVVRSLRARDVTIKGANAFALVSNARIEIRGVFSTTNSATHRRTPGGYNSPGCKGADGNLDLQTGIGPGAGGGGFGSFGGFGGFARNNQGSQTGGAGGMPAGNAELIPLRGGCDGGGLAQPWGSASGGGAIQLVSRTAIDIVGVVAANGYTAVGGGAGGGILLEAPAVHVSGAVVANGAGGHAGCLFKSVAENGRVDDAPAAGGSTCDGDPPPQGTGRGGNGGSARNGALSGQTGTYQGPGDSPALGGHGGGSTGRIRINAAPGSTQDMGLFSPRPSTGVARHR